MKIKSKIIAWLTKGTDIIYTSKGNLPLRDLVFHHEWQFSNEEIFFHEWYTLDGEIVKEGGHIYKLPLNTTLKSKQGKLNG